MVVVVDELLMFLFGFRFPPLEPGTPSKFKAQEGGCLLTTQNKTNQPKASR